MGHNILLHIYLYCSSCGGLRLLWVVRFVVASVGAHYGHGNEANNSSNTERLSVYIIMFDCFAFIFNIHSGFVVCTVFGDFIFDAVIFAQLHQHTASCAFIAVCAETSFVRKMKEKQQQLTNTGARLLLFWVCTPFGFSLAFHALAWAQIYLAFVCYVRFPFFPLLILFHPKCFVFHLPGVCLISSHECE